MEVYAIGTVFKIDGGAARVNRVLIGYGGTVEYELSYWQAGVRKTQWVPECELETAKSSSKEKIGFRKNGSNAQT